MGEKNRHLLDFSTLHDFFMDEKIPAPPRFALSHWNVLITGESIGENHLYCLFFPWSPFIHDLMELPKSWLKSGHCVPLISDKISPGTAFYHQHKLSGRSHSRETCGNVSIPLLTFLPKLCN